MDKQWDDDWVSDPVTGWLSDLASISSSGRERHPYTAPLMIWTLALEILDQSTFPNVNETLKSKRNTPHRGTQHLTYTGSSISPCKIGQEDQWHVSFEFEVPYAYVDTKCNRCDISDKLYDCLLYGSIVEHDTDEGVHADDM